MNKKYGMPFTKVSRFHLDTMKIAALYLTNVYIGSIIDKNEGGGRMKTAFFYAMRELKRRFIHFAGIFFSLGTAIFIPVTLYGYTEARRGNGFNEQFFFFFGVTAVVIFGMSVMALADKYDKFSDDYRMLLRFGLPGHRLMLIQAMEVTVVFCCAAAVFYPLSLGALYVIFRRYNSRLGEIPWIFEDRFAEYHLPEKVEMPEFGVEMVILMAILYVILLLAVIAAYCMCRKRNRMPVDIRLKHGTLYGEEKLAKQNDLSAYAAAVSGRMKRKLKHTGKTAVLSFLVPIVMLCGALASAPVRLQPDVFIMTDSVHSPIPQSVLAELESMDGIESLDVDTYDGLDGERVIIKIHVFLKEENFYETALNIDKIPELSGFEVRLNCFSEIGTNAVYRMNREYFSLAAAEAFVSGIVSLAFLMNDCLALRREEMGILRRLGMNRKKRVMLKVHGNIAMVLPAVLLTGGLGLAVYFGMSIYGGDVLHIGDIALAAAAAAVLTALTAVLSALLAVRSEKAERSERMEKS